MFGYAYGVQADECKSDVPRVSFREKITDTSYLKMDQITCKKIVKFRARSQGKKSHLIVDLLVSLKYDWDQDDAILNGMG